MIENIKIQFFEYYVKGMHCGSCELVVEDSIAKHKSIKDVKANLKDSKVVINFNTEVDPTEIKNDLDLLLKDLGYSLHNEKVINEKTNYKELGLAFFIACLFLGSFILLQKLGVVNLLNANQVTLPFVFFIGVIASLSTCMAVVGGLVLSLSSSYAKVNKNSYLPLVTFHVSRVLSFLILGGVIGLIGSAFTLTSTTTFLISLVLFFVMVVLGLNLLEAFPFVRKLQIKIPNRLRFNVSEGKFNSLTPILLGMSTFFLPCGFTQSMQVYALATGDVLSGAMTMLVFSLGTLPVLALISFASVKLSKNLQSGLFFKTAGFIIIFFAIFNLLAALVAVGLINPLGIF
ncbi:MAG: sulfite exporter TauE/SafE family protein [bacterium]|nr:sulfite exporter TauE/SafE family protein [bacterium]